MQSHQLKRQHQNKLKKRVARGGAHGKTAGRGTKGQKSRAGRKMRPAVRDLIKKLPKLRGRGKNSFKSINDKINLKTAVINIGILEKNFSDGDNVNPRVLANKKLIALRSGKLPRVKLLGDGSLKKKLLVSECQISKSAKEKIEKAGGKIKIKN